MTAKNGQTGSFDTTLASGLRFASEYRENSEGVALALRIPVGSKDDPPGKLGLANLVTDTLFKGTRKHSARALNDAFDFLGLRHSASTGIESTSISMRFLPEYQGKAVALLREVLSEPSFPKKECETAKIQSVQELKHLDDEPLSKAFVHLKELYFGEKWGHNELGHEGELPSIKRDDIHAFWRERYMPEGALLAVAGKFDREALLKDLATLFPKSGARRAHETPPAPPPANVSRHIQKESEQTQIALAYPTVARSDPDYFAAQLGVGVLSGGMSARLFTEVRERRALVYSVGAQASSLRSTGVCYAYAGTTSKRAQETLTVLKAELKRLPLDVTDEEVERARIGVKAHMLMDQESTGARVRELLDDLYFYERIVPLDEIIAKIDCVRANDVKAFWTAHPIEPYALVTVGKEALE